MLISMAAPPTTHQAPANQAKSRHQTTPIAAQATTTTLSSIVRFATFSPPAAPFPSSANPPHRRLPLLVFATPPLPLKLALVPPATVVVAAAICHRHHQSSSLIRCHLPSGIARLSIAPPRVSITNQLPTIQRHQSGAVTLLIPELFRLNFNHKIPHIITSSRSRNNSKPRARRQQK